MVLLALSLLSLALPLAYAGNPFTECSNITFLATGYMSAECPNDKGVQTKSWISLQRWIQNSEGFLVWGLSDNEFGGYIYSCGTASLNSSGYFTATCQNTRGDSKNTGIQLSEHFVTVNGNVVSNLNGPRAPAPPTPIDPPAGSLLYISEFFFGNSQDSATCNYASGGENYFTLYSTAPISCYRLDFDQLGGVTHAKFKVNPGYEYVLYNGTECAGEPVKRSGPAISLNTCDVVSASPLSVILKPVWITN